MANRVAGKNKIARLATIHPTTTHFFASIFQGDYHSTTESLYHLCK